MSLAVLKKKAFNHNPRIAPISGNGTFSLNGTRRQHTYIGVPSFVSKCPITDYSSTVNKSVQTSKALLSVRYSGTGCKGKICSQPVYKVVDGNKTQDEYIENLTNKCYVSPDISGSNKVYNCYTKDVSIGIHKNKTYNNQSYTNFIKLKSLRCSTVKIGPTYNLGSLQYTDHIKKLKSGIDNCK